ncbi:MAG: hypothetical protein ABSA92_07485 [Candidatus Bathyarchaeia archaeon]|jgi:hypothetical protein
MLGNLVAEDRGKTVGVRILPDGKIEQTGQRSGKWWGMEATNLSTNVATIRLDGTFTSEGQGLITTNDGESMSVKIYGVGWPIVKGLAIKERGAAFPQTTSPKFAQANKLNFVFEFESDEKGDYLLKVWEWK